MTSLWDDRAAVLLLCAIVSLRFTSGHSELQHGGVFVVGLWFMASGEMLLLVVVDWRATFLTSMTLCKKMLCLNRLFNDAALSLEIV
jgi:hypothetical protein